MVAATASTNPRVARQNNITLYTTLEPSTRRRGTATPPVTNLIRVANIPRVVIGCPSPVPEKAMLGATALHSAGIEVSLIRDTTIRDECQNLIRDFSISSNCKLHLMARKHYQLFGRPLGFLHWTVIHSDNIEAFRRSGNAFGSNTRPPLGHCPTEILARTNWHPLPTIFGPRPNQNTTRMMSMTTRIVMLQLVIANVLMMNLS